MNKIRIPSYIAIFSSLLFSFASISFSFDVSLFAFPLSLIFSFFTSSVLYFKILRDKNFKFLNISKKLLQYLPFVLLATFVLRHAGNKETAVIYDIFIVLLWCITFVSSLVILYFFDDKRVFGVFSEWKDQKKVKRSKGILATPNISLKTIIFEILDWIDALVQAVCMVLLIQIFILQLYVIPSESMVPSFLIGDRVVVTKTLSGPKFPLSEVGLPCLKKYKRGDVIVFRNPHYSLDRKSEIRTVVSQIVYMLSFTTVNLNVDEKGEPKADPLVKRICGLPGEQILMQDGTLYARNVESNDFIAVDEDSKFAKWNLNDVNPNIKSKIQLLPLSQAQYDVMINIENERKNLNLSKASDECESIVSSFFQYLKNDGLNKKVFNPSNEYEFYEFIFEFITITRELMYSDSLYKTWFNSFMTDWKSFAFGKELQGNDSKDVFDGDLYEEANFKLNIMTKLCIGNLYLRTAELLSLGYSDDEIRADSKILSLLTKASELNFYIMILDQRNMPVFPQNDSDGKARYIPQNCYFMMGDNRFNSLDMRHSYTPIRTKLSKYDSYSVCYYSNMAPQYVNKKYILGSALYRFWPLSRMGTVKTK